MTTSKPSEVLKKFGINDEDILNIALADTLGKGVSILKLLLFKKWDIDTLSAMKLVKELKAELK